MLRYATFLAGGLIALVLAGAANVQDAHPHVADADREYAAEFSRGANPCAYESTALSYEQCIGKELELLNGADRAWGEYKKNLCELQSAGFDGGSGASSIATECQYRADRQYVQQVADAISLKIQPKGW